MSATLRGANARFGNLLTAMATPLHPDGSIDFAGAQSLAKWLMAEGNDALVINGTTGESPTTSDDEKLDLLDAIIEAIGADKVVAGAGGNDTRHISKLAAASAAKGVAGILSVAPYYNKPCQEGIYRHFRAVADAAAIPVLLYNVPGRTIANIDAATTEWIASDQENVIGTKEASGNMMQVADIVARTADTFDVYSGDDGTLLPHLAVGGCGIISVISHIATRQMKDVCNKWFSGDAAGAREAFLPTLGITRMIFAQPSPAPTKAALSLLGKPAGPVRLPLVDLTQSQLEALAAFMTERGLL
ncbi:MAG: 4-hydroxy-tetrahydrodipicolinate synthase [Armatimonadota bacterium]